MTDAQSQALRDLQYEVALLLWEEKSEAHQWALNRISSTTSSTNSYGRTATTTSRKETPPWVSPTSRSQAT